MKKQQISQLAVKQLVLRVLSEHDIWKGNKPFSRAKKALEGAVDGAGKAIIIQSQKSTGVTEDKDSYEASAIARVIAIGNSTAVYALEENNHELYQAMNYSESDLLLIDQHQLVGTLRGIVAAAEPFSAALVDYGVALTAYDEARSAITLFEDAMPNPRLVISRKKAATASIPGIMKTGRLALLKMDKLVPIFAATAPEFVAAYWAARNIVHTRGRRRKASAGAKGAPDSSTGDSANTNEG